MIPGLQKIIDDYDKHDVLTQVFSAYTLPEILEVYYRSLMDGMDGLAALEEQLTKLYFEKFGDEIEIEINKINAYAFKMDHECPFVMAYTDPQKGILRDKIYSRAAFAAKVKEVMDHIDEMVGHDDH